MRKLATIDVIKNILPIENADQIEVAEVRGWKVIVKKNEFKEGDKVVYFEIDSIIPDREPFTFLGNYCHKKKQIVSEGKEVEGFLLKTKKMRGVYSQGLVLKAESLNLVDMNIGDDVSETLEIYKYDPPVPQDKTMRPKGNFPGFLRKTDAERIQNIDVFPEGKCVATLKYDGTSFTCFKFNGEFGVCSRNLLLDVSDNIYWQIARKYDLENKLDEGFCIQGEVYGVGVQDNPHKLNDLKFAVFDVFDIQSGEYLNCAEAREYAENKSLDFVKTIKSFSFSNTSIDDLFKLADETGLEGLVLRGENNFKVKVISNKYLTKN